MADLALVARAPANLPVGPADDPLEREADLVARWVVATLGQTDQRSPEDAPAPASAETGVLRRAVVGEPGGALDESTSAQLRSALGSGRPLPERVRHDMERVFGADFGAVRVHVGPTANALNERIGSHAFTIGSDIFFREGAYRPHSSEGQHLLAHELTHTIQQQDREGRVETFEHKPGAPRLAGSPIALTPVGRARIQRSLVKRRGDEPLPTLELDRIRLAIERGPNPESIRYRLVHLIDDTKEWTFAEALDQLDLVEGSLPSAEEAAKALGHRPGFEFTKSVRYHDDIWTMSFTRDETTLDEHERTKPAKLIREQNLQKPVVIRGYRSEDENPIVARNRAYEVRRELVAAGYTSKAEIDLTSEGTKGNYDYREMRRVEVRPADEVKPQTLDDGRILSTDPRYKQYGIQDSLDRAQKLIDGAVGKLRSITASTPADDNVKATFRSFFTTAAPADIITNLELARAQIEHYRPEAPADASAPEGGHACLDASRPGLFYLNQGVGAEARMIAGVISLTATPGAKAYNIVHEATHGAPALQTRDYAYRWQRLFAFLSPELQIKNADSYAVLVGILEGLTQARLGMTAKEADLYDLPAAADTAVPIDGLPPRMQEVLAATWAWFQHYAAQLYLNFRDLYPSVASGASLPPDSYQGKLYATTADVFGLGPSEIATIAGIIDRLDDLNAYANWRTPYYVAAEPKTGPPVPYFPIVVPPGLSSMNSRDVMSWQVRVMLDTVETTRAMQASYLELFRKVIPMSEWGGPLG